MTIIALDEAVESAVREVTREPQSPRATEATGSMIHLLHEVLDSPEMAALATADPSYKPAQRAQLAQNFQKVAGNLRRMLDLAVHIERLGGTVPWHGQLAQALERLNRTLVQAGLQPPPSSERPRPVSEAAPALLAKLRAFLANASPERLKAARLENIAIVADIVDQQYEFLRNFLALNERLGHAGDDWFREMSDLLGQLESQREEIWSLIDIATADAALAESDERIPYEQVRRELGF